jgi:8-oxo-dGTP diphosphatase
MKTIIVTAGLILEKEKILVTQRKEEDSQGLLWEFPGGKVKPGEEPRQALKRELMEELGIEVEVGMIFDTVFHIYPENPIFLLIYSCQIQKGIPKPLGCHDLQWVTAEELKQLPMPAADGPVQNRLSFMEGSLHS